MTYVRKFRPLSAVPHLTGTVTLAADDPRHGSAAGRAVRCDCDRCRVWVHDLWQTDRRVRSIEALLEDDEPDLSYWGEPHQEPEQLVFRSEALQ